MKVKVNRLSGASLDWVVATQCEGIEVSYQTDFITADPINVHADWDRAKEYSPSSIWDQGGEIYARHATLLEDVGPASAPARWRCVAVGGAVQYGVTPLVAVCRAYVSSIFGEEVDIPDEVAAELFTIDVCVPDPEGSPAPRG